MVPANGPPWCQHLPASADHAPPRTSTPKSAFTCRTRGGRGRARRDGVNTTNNSVDCTLAAMHDMCRSSTLLSRSGVIFDQSGLGEEGPVSNTDFSGAVDACRQVLHAVERIDPGPVAEHFSRTSCSTPGLHRRDAARSRRRVLTPLIRGVVAGWCPATTRKTIVVCVDRVTTDPSPAPAGWRSLGRTIACRSTSGTKLKGVRDGWLGSNPRLVGPDRGGDVCGAR